MNLALVFAALVALCQGSPMSTDTKLTIEGGTDAKEGEFPYQVSLQTRGGFHICGGSILSPDYVVTAAHCVVKKAHDEIQVVYGVTDLTKSHQTEFVHEIIIHPGYNTTNHDDVYVNDIALLKVTRFTYSNDVSNVILPAQGFKVPDFVNATFSGWGRLGSDSRFSKVLQRVNLMTLPQLYCKDIYSIKKREILPTHLCAHDFYEYNGPCTGDEGGPLTIDGKLEGILSSFWTCGSRPFPSVFTRVAEYVDWINSYIA